MQCLAHRVRCDCSLPVLLVFQGEIVYHTAAVGIVYNPATHTQRQYLGHSDDGAWVLASVAVLCARACSLHAPVLRSDLTRAAS